MRHRYVILVAAVLMQACLGATYSWSVFVDPLRLHAGVSQATAQWPFNLFYIAFPATTIASGISLRRLGPRGCAIIGGLIFGAGWMVASLGHWHFAMTAIGIGLLAGVGVGFAYIVPISVGMLWFPGNKGLVTGVAVAGFGGGAALVSHLAGQLMAVAACSPFLVFRLFGVIFLLAIATAGAFMRYPPGYQARAVEPVSAAAIIGDRYFHLLYLAMFASLAAGFAVNANLKQLCPGIDARAGAMAVGIFAIANAAGRVGWGLAFDRAFSTAAIRLNLLAQAVLMLAAPSLIRTPQGLYALAAMAGFNYGGVLVLYASATAHRWGPQHVGQIYGWLFSANIAASFAPTLVAYAYGRLGTYSPSLFVLAGMLLAASLIARPLWSTPGKTSC